MKKYIPFIILVVAVAGYYIGRHFYFKPAYDSGQVAPDFTGTRPDGTTFKLSDLKGNYVLLDFWGSCKANPGLVALYDKYNGKSYKDADNFEIVSVGMERREASWLKAIEKDGLKWSYHTADFTERGQNAFETELAMAYGIKWAPTTFLLDPKGNILEVSPSKDKLDAFLADKLK